jgi:hypothetical protein
MVNLRRIHIPSYTEQGLPLACWLLSDRSLLNLRMRLELLVSVFMNSVQQAATAGDCAFPDESNRLLKELPMTSLPDTIVVLSGYFLLSTVLYVTVT